MVVVKKIQEVVVMIKIIEEVMMMKMTRDDDTDFDRSTPRLSWHDRKGSWTVDKIFCHSGR